MLATQDHALILHELTTMGMNLARAIYADAMDARTPTPEQVNAFERVGRTVRRTILLARRLAEAPAPETRRTQARERIIREVEDAIAEEHGDTEHAETLRAELSERLDAPDLDEDFALRPLPDVIADIRHDLGLDPAPGIPPGASRPWRRRTPAVVTALRRRAAAPSPAATRRQPDHDGPPVPWPLRRPDG